MSSLSAVFEPAPSYVADVTLPFLSTRILTRTTPSLRGVSFCMGRPMMLPPSKSKSPSSPLTTPRPSILASSAPSLPVPCSDAPSEPPPPLCASALKALDNRESTVRSGSGSGSGSFTGSGAVGTETSDCSCVTTSSATAASTGSLCDTSGWTTSSTVSDGTSDSTSPAASATSPMSANPTATNCSPGGGMDLVKATRKKHATTTPAKEKNARMAALIRSFFSPSRRRFSRMACMHD